MNTETTTTSIQADGRPDAGPDGGQTAAPAGQAVNFAYFMHVRTTPTWLALTPADRFAFLDDTVRPLLARHRDVRMRFFDSEAFTARTTDVLMWETGDVLAYQALVEELRETPFWDSYFEITEIVPAIENAYAQHYGVDPY